MASKNKVLQQKCPPRTKNYDYGVIVAWIFSQPKFLDEPKNQQFQCCCVNSEYLVLSTKYSVLSTQYLVLSTKY